MFSTFGNAPKPSKVALTALLLLISCILSINTWAASATARVGITKIPSLSVTSMDNAELYRNASGNQLSTTTCFQAQGNSIPFRVSASSLTNNSAFSLGNSTSAKQIPYSVLWSDSNSQQRLWDNGDLSDVVQVNPNAGCEMKTLSVNFNDADYNAVNNGTYTDTLSVMIVIE